MPAFEYAIKPPELKRKLVLPIQDFLFYYYKNKPTTFLASVKTPLKEMRWKQGNSGK
jgi:hypothetical protein